MGDLKIMLTERNQTIYKGNILYDSIWHYCWKNMDLNCLGSLTCIFTNNKCYITARRSNQSILKEISPRISLEGMMLKLKLQYFGHLMRRVDSLEKTLMLGGIGPSAPKVSLVPFFKSVLPFILPCFPHHPLLHHYSLHFLDYYIQLTLKQREG